jgi:hypothetical protein
METIMSRLSLAVLALSLIAAVVATPADAAQRAFVSSSGNDANTASGCGLAAPCRSFSSAQTVVSDGGEIVALDAAGYGPITVTKSVTITANPGFYAGIAASTGTAVTINTAGVNVILRGLNINGTGASYGVVMTNGNRLSIEDCIISNFYSDGVAIYAPATVRIVDSIIRDGSTGIYLDTGATATISGVKVLGNLNAGVLVVNLTASAVTTAAISDSVASGNGYGIYAYAGAGVTARASVTRATSSNNNYGIAADSGPGTQVITVSDSLVTGNAQCGLCQYSGAGTSTLESLGNNTVRQNTTNAVGTITTVSPL